SRAGGAVRASSPNPRRRRTRILSRHGPAGHSRRRRRNSIFWRPFAERGRALEQRRRLTQRRELHDGRRDDDHEQHRQKEYDHRHGQLRRQRRRQFLGFYHAIVAAFLSRRAQRLGERRAVFFGLDQDRRNLFDVFKTRPQAEILIGDAPIRQIGKL